MTDQAVAEEAAIKAMAEEGTPEDVTEQEATPQGRGRGGRNTPRAARGRVAALPLAQPDIVALLNVMQQRFKAQEAEKQGLRTSYNRLKFKLKIRPHLLQLLHYTVTRS